MNTIQKLLLILATTSILISCGGEKTENLTDLKSKQAELKTQLAEINAKILTLQGDSGKKSTLVQTSVIQPQIFKTYINVQGRIDAEESVSLSSEIPGIITKILVTPGETVNKGQVLAETDSRALQQSLSDLQINADLVNQLYEKQKSLWEQKIGTEVQYLQAKTQKESIEKKLSTLQEQLRMSKIISPIDGTVDAVDVKLGMLTAPGMPAIRVVNFNNLKIKADMAESYAAKVHKGDEVLVRFPDTNDTLIANINYASRAINPMSRTFGVEIKLNNNKEYHPNQICVLNINDYTSTKPVVCLPVNYIQKDLSGKSFLLISEKDVASKRYIKTGKEYNGKIEVIEGIDENTKVITGGFESVNEGDLLRTKE
ncbi:MAG: efflux RND transporter periplasmic adaptor subunit [Sphingobacteriaceae bacterium]|nr:efflux RND transporter periplasmic adaptor subunit [Sphingobacteriaceae bacterium]